MGGVTVGQATSLAANDFFKADADIPLDIALAELLSNDRPGVTFDRTDGRCVVLGATCRYATPPGDGTARP